MSSPAGTAGWLARLERAGRWLENLLLMGLLLVMLGLGGAQIVLRNFLGGGMSWADEALRLLLLWLALLGAVAASRDDRHISIDVLGRVLPPRWRLAAGVVVSLFTAGVCLVLAWHALGFVGESREYGDTLLGDQPAWLFQAILPAGFGLIAYRYLLLALRRALALLRPGSSA